MNVWRHWFLITVKLHYTMAMNSFCFTECIRCSNAQIKNRAWFHCQWFRKVWRFFIEYFKGTNTNFHGASKKPSMADKLKYISIAHSVNLIWHCPDVLSHKSLHTKIFAASFFFIFTQTAMNKSIDIVRVSRLKRWLRVCLVQWFR